MTKEQRTQLLSAKADVSMVAKGSVFAGAAVLGVAGATLHFAANGVRSIAPDLESKSFKEVATLGFESPTRWVNSWKDDKSDDTVEAVL